MMKWRTILMTTALTMAASARAEEAAPARVEIRLANFSFSPEALRLAAGKPVTLHFVNRGPGTHNFAAPEFFKAARVTAGAGVVHDGTIELAKDAAADVTLTPAKGRYPVKCTHFMHAMFGMKGEITVD